MIERGLKAELEIESVMKFAQVLAGWDSRIVEVISISSLTGNELPEGDNLELVCRFDPQPRDDHHGYSSSFNLLFRDDHENASDNLGITNPNRYCDALTDYTNRKPTLSEGAL